MTFDDLSITWKEQNDQPLSSEDREAVVMRVCRRAERLGGVVVRRDLVETIAAVFVMFIFGQHLFTSPADYVVSKFGAGFVVCWAVFIIYKLHRTRTIQKPASPDASVREFCRTEIGRLDRQIRLLRGVLWWYIAPCLIGANIMYLGIAGLGAATLAYSISTVLLGWGIYLLNMYAVKKSLVPARNELASLLNRLDDADVTQQSVEQPDKPSSKFRRFFSIAVLLMLLVAFGSAVAVGVSQPGDYPKRAPFSAIRWEGNKPVVRIGEEWFTLVSVDGVAVEEIVSFSRWTYVDKWRKRFDEDLVEVLTRMGHEPKETARLVVSPLGSQVTQTLEDVPMTEANRQAIYRAADR